MPFCTSRRKRKDRIETIQSLNGRLFVHTKHCRVARRMHVETNDIGGFGFEIRIVRRHIAFESMGLQTSVLPTLGQRSFSERQDGLPICGRSNA